jgi:hypothetical protein
MPKITVHGGPTDASVPVVDTKPASVPEPPVEPLERPEGTDYSVWSYKELLAELKERELPRGGNTAELVARLWQDDRDKE